MLEDFLYWVKERESIRKRKEQGEAAPWTDDPILQTYRFCNVRRRDDRVSQWMIQHTLPLLDSFEDKFDFIKWVALCRWVNWPPTLALFTRDIGIDGKLDWKAAGQEIDRICSGTRKAWTGAYMVRAPSKIKFPGMTKGLFVVEVVVDKALTEHKASVLAALKTNSVQATWDALVSMPNWGSFMAGQVVADFTYTPLLASAYDLYTWAPQGPGSVRGYNRLLGRPLKFPVSDKETWCLALRSWRVSIIEELGPEYETLTLHDVQNCLCEVDKYLRVKNGEGRPRSKYKPETAY